MLSTKMDGKQAKKKRRREKIARKITDMFLTKTCKGSESAGPSISAVTGVTPRIVN